MQRIDRFILTGLFILTVVLAGIAASRSYQQRRTVATESKAILLKASDAIVIGVQPDFSGNPHSPYTLVEFADYQCPPYRTISRQLPNVLAQYPDKLRFTFRNYPLSFHLYAKPAAIAAEAAREQGQFWPMHDALFAEELDADSIVKLARAQHLDRAKFDRACATTAKAAVQTDLKEAEALHLPGTPSFIICCPDGRVVRLGSLRQLAEYVK